MAMRYLGETFDIHGGGMDLIFPHHENEVAQSECATGKVFSKYWLHHGLTRFNTKKVSKSDPEMAAAMERMTLSRLLERYDGELLRFFILSTHYRRPIDFSDEELEAKRKALSTFHRLFERVERIAGRSPFEGAALSSGAGPLLTEIAENRARFEQAMDDDFNTAASIAVLFDAATRINRFIDEHELEAGGDPKGKVESLEATRGLVALGRLIGLFLRPPPPSSAGSGLINDVMQVLIEVRAHLRKNKDFATADLLRTRLGEIGVTLEDRPDGTLWRHEG
jgi:cysteinyl-tRNA synthetase